LGLWLEGYGRGDRPVAIKADVVALTRLIRYSEEEALRLGVSGVVIECLRMARIELTNTIEKGGSAASGPAGDDEPVKAARMN
jgi:hypothetical protein